MRPGRSSPDRARVQRVRPSPQRVRCRSFRPAATALAPSGIGLRVLGVDLRHKIRIRSCCRCRPAISATARDRSASSRLRSRPKLLATGERRDALSSKTGDLGTQGSDEFQLWDEVHRFAAYIEANIIPRDRLRSLPAHPTERHRANNSSEGDLRAIRLPRHQPARRLAEFGIGRSARPAAPHRSAWQAQAPRRGRATRHYRGYGSTHREDHASAAHRRPDSRRRRWPLRHPGG